MGLRYGLVLVGFSIIGIGWGSTDEANAGMIGSPIAIHPRHAIVGAIEGSIINRELAFDAGSSPDISLTKIQLRGTYGLFDRVNVFLTLGTVDDDFKVVNYNGTDVTFLADQAIAYGGGFKLTIYGISNFLLGAGGQYEQFTLASSKSTSTSPSADAELKWQELRFFMGAHLKDIPYFVPYGGLYLTAVRGELSFSRPTPPATDVEESQSVGLFYGGDFKWKRLVLSAEIHLISESSVAFSLQYTF
jgi:hypothetical protein